MSTPFGDKFEENFCANLLRWRSGLGLTPADAARKLDLTAQTYGRYEKGERFPDGVSLLKISRKIGVQMEAMLHPQLVIKPNHGATLESTIREIARDELARVFTTAASYLETQAESASVDSIETVLDALDDSEKPQLEAVARLFRACVRPEAVAHRSDVQAD